MGVVPTRAVSQQEANSAHFGPQVSGIPVSDPSHRHRQDTRIWITHLRTRLKRVLHTSTLKPLRWSQYTQRWYRHLDTYTATCTRLQQLSKRTPQYHTRLLRFLLPCSKCRSSFLAYALSVCVVHRPSKPLPSSTSHCPALLGAWLAA